MADEGLRPDPEGEGRSSELRAAAALVRGRYRRARLPVVAVLAVATPLLVAASVGAASASGARPLFAAFTVAGPVFLAFDWVVSIVFLRRLAAARDTALRDIEKRMEE